MKKPLLFLSATLLVSVLSAQSITSKTDVINSDVVATPTNTDLPGFNSSEDAEKIIAGIMDVLGLHPNFKIKIGHIPNVEADIRHRQRYIIYNPEFVHQVNKTAKNKWASIFIIAHEIGHHLNGHTLKAMKTQPVCELEADEFGGFVLSKMGATLAEAQLVMHYIAGMDASESHPGRLDRLVAIEKGWSKANEQSAKNSQPVPSPQQSN
jgi:hypothetical protein